MHSNRLIYDLAQCRNLSQVTPVFSFKLRLLVHVLQPLPKRLHRQPDRFKYLPIQMESRAYTRKIKQTGRNLRKLFRLRSQEIVMARSELLSKPIHLIHWASPVNESLSTSCIDTPTLLLVCHYFFRDRQG